MKQSRSGFTLIFAIFLLLAMSGAMALMLSFSAENVSKTSDIYLKEQAQVLSKSATEYALLAISGHDRTATNDCINTINSTYSPNGTTLFDINTTIKYIGLGTIGGCASLNGAENITTADSAGTVIIDVIVTSKLADPVIRYHRRTLQKP